jgi:hypothetical protein
VPMAEGDEPKKAPKGEKRGDVEVHAVSSSRVRLCISRQTLVRVNTR